MEAQPEPIQQTPLFSKAVIDPINTAAWFTMDALWLAKIEWPAYAATAVTILTGVLLLILGRREGRGALYADLALNCWIVMNSVWLLHDLNDRDTPRAFAAVMGGLGAVFILAAARHSQDLHRVRIFKR
jgi:hypothetical protein